MAMRRQWNPAEAEVRCYKKMMAMHHRWNPEEAEVNQSSGGDAMMRRLMVLGAKIDFAAKAKAKFFFVFVT